MSLPHPKVIIFGPTGGVGSITALEASRRGAHVYLAMRDPTKSIPGIPLDTPGYTRLQSDLSDPLSVSSAVKTSGAKAAYIYWIPGPDNMRATINALKSSGIEHVVFLSTFTIFPGMDVRAIPASEIIPFGHAQIEIGLEDAGLAFTALRPANFASNHLKQFLTQDGQGNYKATVAFGAMKQDCIVPGDIGRVSGAVLVDPPSKSAKEVIYLCGPQLLSVDDQWAIIKRHAKSEIELMRHTPTQQKEFMLAKEFPEPLVEYLIKWFEYERDHEEAVYTEPMYSDGVANVQKYSGYEATGFEEYIVGEGAALLP